jgi:hypothetical protein
MNFIECTLKDEGGVTKLLFGNSQISLPEASGRRPEVMAYIDQTVIMGVRPEDIHDEEIFVSQFPDSQVEMGVEVVELMGSETYLYMYCEGRQITARVSPRSTARAGDKITVAFDSKKIHLFDKETEKAISPPVFFNHLSANPPRSRHAQTQNIKHNGSKSQYSRRRPKSACIPAVREHHAECFAKTL